jgi:hypothetical protein
VASGAQAVNGLVQMCIGCARVLARRRCRLLPVGRKRQPEMSAAKG